MKLNKTNISKIGTQITAPTYDSKQLKIGIVHIGVGGFHRSHQANYVHQLLQKHGLRIGRYAESACGKLTKIWRTF